MLLPLLVACAPLHLPPPTPVAAVEALRPRLDAADADLALQRLKTYVAIPSLTPASDDGQVRAVEQLAAWLAEDGITAEVDRFAPNFANLIARLPPTVPSPAEGPLCLLSHVDVVPAETGRWQHAPFAAEVDEAGWLHGRGVLDMKGIGILELSAFRELAASDVPRRREVVLLAVSDEEGENAGARRLAARWSELGCAHVLNEGGMGVRGAVVDDLTTFGVSTTEKGHLWAKLVAHGPPGHGSTPRPDDAPARLMDALARLQRFQPAVRVQPQLTELLADVGRHAGGLTGAVLRSEGATRVLAVPALRAEPLTAAILADTVHVTGFGGAEAPNVVPSTVWAQLDVRLLPGTSVDAMTATLREVVAAVPEVELVVLSAAPAAVSPTDDDVYAAIVRQLRLAFPDAAVGPLVMPGSTDCAYLRPLGARCYGVAPFPLPAEVLEGMHGDDERLPVEVFRRGLDVFFGIVLEATIPR
jgi:acetylornithine deacetylase/succinyl-diaminopimelate desuccinylase-like protein